MGEDQSESILTHPVSRRSLLTGAARGAGAFGLTMALARCTPAKEGSDFLSQLGSSGELIIPPTTPGNEFNITVSSNEVVPPLPGLGWAPDGHTSFIKKPGGSFSMWVAAGPQTYLVEASSLTMQNAVVSPQPVLQGENTTTEHGFNGYTGFGSVLPGRSQGELIGIYHNENWLGAGQGFPFNASVGVAISTDSGMSWERKGPVLTGAQPATRPGEFGNRAMGAGQPSALVRNVDGVDYVYTYYVDWNVEGPDSIHLARVPLTTVDQAQTWEKHTESGFVNISADAQRSVPVISPPTDKDNKYAALPSVSFNTELGKFVAVYETDLGFYSAVSDDGISWRSNTEIAHFPQPQSARKDGDIWYSYPTLLSPDAPDHTQTTANAVLVYSKGDWNRSPHRMMQRSVTIK